LCGCEFGEIEWEGVGGLGILSMVRDFLYTVRDAYWHFWFFSVYDFLSYLVASFLARFPSPAYVVSFFTFVSIPFGMIWIGHIHLA